MPKAVEITYNVPEGADPVARQAHGQVAGLNEVTAGEIRTNIESYRTCLAENGRRPSADSMPSEEMEVTVRESSGSTKLARLHEPDGIVGGCNVVFDTGDVRM